MGISDKSSFPSFKANLEVDVRALFGLPPEKVAPKPQASVAEFAQQKVQAEFAKVATLHGPAQNQARRNFIDSLQVYNAAVGAHQESMIAGLESPFVSTPELIRQSSVIQTSMQRDIILNARDQMRKLANDAQDLWGTSRQNDRELHSHFEEVAQQLTGALTQFDAGNADAAFATYRRILSENEAHMGWMARDLHHSEQLKHGAEVGLTSAAIFIATLATDGVAAVALGPEGVAALSGGARLGLFVGNTVVFSASHRALEQKILHIPFWRKDGVAANAIDFGIDVVRTTALMGALKLVGEGAALGLPIAKTEPALIAMRNFGAELSGFNAFDVAAGGDPHEIFTLHHQLDQLSFLLGLRAANGVIAGIPSMMKGAAKVYRGIVEASPFRMDILNRGIGGRQTTAAYGFGFFDLAVSNVTKNVLDGLLILMGVVAVDWIADRISNARRNTRSAESKDVTAVKTACGTDPAAIEARKAIVDQYFNSDPTAGAIVDQLFAHLNSMHPQNAEILLLYLPQALVEAAAIPLAPEAKARFLLTIYSNVVPLPEGGTFRPPSVGSYNAYKMVETIKTLLQGDGVDRAKRAVLIDWALHFKCPSSWGYESFVIHDLPMILKAIESIPSDAHEVIDLLTVVSEQPSLLESSDSIASIVRWSAEGISVPEQTRRLVRDHAAGKSARQYQRGPTIVGSDEELREVLRASVPEPEYQPGDLEMIRDGAKLQISKLKKDVQGVVEIARKGNVGAIAALVDMAQGNQKTSAEAQRAIAKLYFDGGPAAITPLSELFASLDAMPGQNRKVLLSVMPKALMEARRIPVSPAEKMGFMRAVFNKVELERVWRATKMLGVIGEVLGGGGMDRSKKTAILDAVLAMDVAPEHAVDYENFIIHGSLSKVLQAVQYLKPSAEQVIALIRMAYGNTFVDTDPKMIRLISGWSSEGRSLDDQIQLVGRVRAFLGR